MFPQLHKTMEIYFIYKYASGTKEPILNYHRCSRVSEKIVSTKVLQIFCILVPLYNLNKFKVNIKQ